MNILPIGIFYAYAQEDEALQNELEKHLSLLKREGLITGWHFRMISGGKEWQGEIDSHINKSKIILLLVSPDFLSSDYCYDVEMKKAMELHKSKAARVIPVILRPCDWHSAPFGKLQALPKDGKPITTWPNRDEAFLNVAQGIRQVCRELQGTEGSDSGLPSTAIQEMKGSLSPELAKVTKQIHKIPPTIFIYCKQCGGALGASTNCPNYYSHDFVKVVPNAAFIYCERCGVVPGEVTNCPNYYSHDFVEAKPDAAFIYCERCGVVPGEITECPNYYSHDFFEEKECPT